MSRQREKRRKSQSGRLVNINTQAQVSIGDLRNADIFAGFSDNDLEQIVKVCHRRSFQAGEHCAVQGVPSNELQLVKDGKIAIEIRVEAEPYAQILRIATLTKGNILDFTPFLEPHAPTASAICIEKAEIIYIKTAELESVFKQKPSIEFNLMKNLVAIMGSRFKASRTQLARLVAEMVKQGKQS